MATLIRGGSQFCLGVLGANHCVHPVAKNRHQVYFVPAEMRDGCFGLQQNELAGRFFCCVREMTD